MEIKRKIPLRTVKLGSIGVDTGTMMFCDPCYVIGKETGSWEEFCEKKYDSEFDEKNGDIVSLSKTDFSNGAVFHTGFGDGAYQVELEVGDFGEWGERVISANITFITQEDIEKMEEREEQVTKGTELSFKVPYARTDQSLVSSF